MKWILIDWKNGDLFETVLSATTREEALSEARAAWNRLSPHDQRTRQDFYVVYAALDDDGIPDYNSATDTIAMAEITSGEEPPPLR